MLKRKRNGRPLIVELDILRDVAMCVDHYLTDPDIGTAELLRVHLGEYRDFMKGCD